MSGAAPTWRCPACDTYNAAAERVCEICGTARTAAAPAAKRPPAEAVPKTAPEPGARPVPKSKPKPRAASKPKPAAKSAAKPAVRPASKPKPKPPSKSEPGPAAKRPLTAADEGWRAGPEIAALLPEIFNEDGTLKADRLDELIRAEGGPPLLATEAVRARGSTAAADELRRKAEAASKEAPETTPGQEAAACGCLLVLVGALVYGIVMLVMHWGAVTGWAGHAVGIGKGKPAPIVAASGPCPSKLLGTLPAAESAGARLAAVYRRTDVAEEYVLCRTAKGQVYFVQIDGDPSGSGARMGDPVPAKAISGGYEEGPASGLVVFRSGTMTYEVGGAKKWTAKYEGETSVTARS